MNWEEWLGLKFTAFVAGIVGGVISLTFEAKLSFLRALTLILVGGSTAGYSFKFAEVYFDLDSQFAGFFGFTAGLIGMRLINTLLIVVEIIQKDPVILLSLPRFFQSLKNGSLIVSDTDRATIVPVIDIHTSGENSSKGELPSEGTISKPGS